MSGKNKGRKKERNMAKKKWIVYVYDVVEEETFDHECDAENFAERRERVHQQVTRTEEIESDD